LFQNGDVTILNHRATKPKRRHWLRGPLLHWWL